MPITFISNSGGLYSIPVGGVGLWNGGTPPSGYSAYGTSGLYIMSGAAKGSLGGNASHTHSFSAAIGGAGGHAHSPSVYFGSSAAGLRRGNVNNVDPRSSTGEHGHGISGNTTSDGSHGHNMTSGTNGTVSSSEPNSPAYINLSWIIKVDSSAPIINGMILMWYGTTFPAPSDKFKLCNGSNGTPDMRGLFVRESGQAVASASHSHYVGQLINDGNGNHAHTYNNNSNYASEFGNYARASGGVGMPTHFHNVAFTTDGSIGTHGHGVASLVAASTSLPARLLVYFIQYKEA